MIETERLHIRRFRPEDWRDLHEYLSDPEVVLYEPYGVFSEDQCRLEAASRADNSAFWAVCLRDSGKLIGNIYLHKADFDTWELGYVFNRAFQGLGYAAESAKAVMLRAFHEWHARRIVAMCNPENQRSWTLLERLGMRREGHFRQNIYFKRDSNDNPIWQDTYQYAVLSEEWDTADRTLRQD